MAGLLGHKPVEVIGQVMGVDRELQLILIMELPHG